MSTTFDETWIGQGMKLPNPFNSSKGTIDSNTGSDRIKQSIFYILSTIPGERFFVPEFGSDLYKAIFEPNDDILGDLIVNYVSSALKRWEPRITVLSVEPNIGSEGNYIPINITYRLKATNMTDNYVYPFRTKAMQLGGDL